MGMDRRNEYILEGGKPATLIKKIPPYSFCDENNQDNEIWRECEPI